jgi:tetratricopeptide (TPR) repeat protein
LWYQFTLFDAYLQVGGQYTDETIKLADDVLRGKTTEEAFYYKGMAYAAQGKTDAAKQQLQLALRFNKHYDAAHTALSQLGG